MEPHDNNLTFIATESELIRTGAQQPPSAGFDWPRVRPDQFADIPFLARVARRDRSQKGSVMVVNDPDTRAELEALFAAYERALVGNDVAALYGFFVDATEVLRFGGTVNLYGIEEIRAFRAARSPVGLGRVLDRKQITTYGRDLGIAATLFRRTNAPGKIGRQMQTWVRFPYGWRIVAAHVSVIDEPKGA